MIVTFLEKFHSVGELYLALDFWSVKKQFLKEWGMNRVCHHSRDAKSKELFQTPLLFHCEGGISGYFFPFPKFFNVA